MRPKQTFFLVQFTYEYSIQWFNYVQCVIVQINICYDHDSTNFCTTAWSSNIYIHTKDNVLH